MHLFFFSNKYLKKILATEFLNYSIKGNARINGKKNIRAQWIYYYNEAKYEMELALCLKVQKTSIDGMMAYIFNTTAIRDSPWLTYDSVGMYIYMLKNFYNTLGNLA